MFIKNMDFKFTKTKTIASIIIAVLVFLFYLIREIKFASSLVLVVPYPIKPKYDVIIFFSAFFGLICFLAIFIILSLFQPKLEVKKK